GRPRHFHDRTGGETGTNPRLRGDGTRLLGERKTGESRYRQAKETERGGRSVRESECLVVPRKQGNAAGGPSGGKGAPVHGAAAGKDGWDIEPMTVSTQLPQIALAANLCTEEPDA
ncbi:hypothetical protein, partial [Archangium sp.]|uniref:hypothetical protein n=1 Tax=Archangium sp. TaxID=1872627 RepID=UPI002D494F57